MAYPYSLLLKIAELIAFLVLTNIQIASESHVSQNQYFLCQPEGKQENGDKATRTTLSISLQACRVLPEKKQDANCWEPLDWTTFALNNYISVAELQNYYAAPASGKNLDEAPADKASSLVFFFFI
jgi:hypothetical protein